MKQNSGLLVIIYREEMIMKMRNAYWKGGLVFSLPVLIILAYLLLVL